MCFSVEIWACEHQCNASAFKGGCVCNVSRYAKNTFSTKHNQKTSSPFKQKNIHHAKKSQQEQPISKMPTIFFFSDCSRWCSWNGKFIRLDHPHMSIPTWVRCRQHHACELCSCSISSNTNTFWMLNAHLLTECKFLRVLGQKTISSCWFSIEVMTVSRRPWKFQKQMVQEILWLVVWMEHMIIVPLKESRQCFHGQLGKPNHLPLGSMCMCPNTSTSQRVRCIDLLIGKYIATYLPIGAPTQ